MSQVFEVLNRAVEKYSSRTYLEDLMKAKGEYFELVGKISDEDDDFESRMNGFNYWFLLERELSDGTTLLKDFLSSNELEAEVANSLEMINHSLFEYRGLSLTKKHVFYDILHDTKFHVLSENFNFQLIKDDIFTARTVTFNGVNYVLNDISTLPSEIKSILVRESKKVRKLKDKKRDLQFLIMVEKLKTKWKRYGHIDARKIFTFKF